MKKEGYLWENSSAKLTLARAKTRVLAFIEEI
jgi:hypothetical protein